MSLQDAINFGAGIAVLMICYCIQVLQRACDRHFDYLAKLTRRVWILEGSPPCECQATTASFDETR